VLVHSQEEAVEDKQTILMALRRATMSKEELRKITGLPYGPLGYALATLINEKKVMKDGMRYRLIR
jgi:predicted transcriptional regulator